MPALPASAVAAVIETRKPIEVIMAREAGPDFDRFMERTGIEPVTSGLQSRRSPS
jgi:hypothetical protein